jgi:hypothetical protein
LHRMFLRRDQWVASNSEAEASLAKACFMSRVNKAARGSNTSSNNHRSS